MTNTDTFGTREWSKTSDNFITGCKNDCKYCYAKMMANRFKRIPVGGWSAFTIRNKDLNKKRKRTDGVVMFPTSHDIFPEIIDQCKDVINKILKCENKILIVSKPYLCCIKDICDEFEEYKNNIEFRFTIGCNNNVILKHWEPGSTTYEERIETLKYTYDNGWNNSVSIEPILDIDNLVSHINTLYNYVNGDIWLGVMNRYSLTDNSSNDEIKNLINRSRNKDNILALYDIFKDDNKIKWTKNTRKMLNF